jgi:hypothetical protein
MIIIRKGVCFLSKYFLEEIDLKVDILEFVMEGLFF